MRTRPVLPRWLVASSKGLTVVRRETSRMSFLMCLFCVRFVSIPGNGDVSRVGA
jgi:hypothetical protein